MGIHTPNHIVNEIALRGALLGLKKGSYGALILEWWWNQGCPAVSEPDRLMQTAIKAKAAESPGKYGKK